MQASSSLPLQPHLHASNNNTIYAVPPARKYSHQKSFVVSTLTSMRILTFAASSARKQQQFSSPCISLCKRGRHLNPAAPY
mmetsp:Transcript_13619/g.36837  ORF Transcript_13619/g.36837 Transcript_13619/m.36837 type:complete len:81 (-) Transcript_13619:246-488(-)